MTSIRRSLFISLAERYLLIVLQLASFFILARLLTPEDIGLYSVSAAFIGLAQVVRSFGVGSYLIQEKELTFNRKCTAFTITLIIGVAFFIIIQLIAPAIASFYNDERMMTILSLLAFNFLIIPFNSITLAILRRDMKFGVLFWINIAAAIASTTAVLILAVLDFGFMSLVWASIVNTATTCLGGFVHRRSEFWLKLTLIEWRRVSAIGAKITLTSVTGEISTSSNDIFAGKFLGFEAVGLISRAMGVMYLFHRDITAAIRGVAFPVFSKAIRDNSDIEQQYVTSVISLTAIAFPFYGFFAIFPLESLQLMFGSQWDAAAPLVVWFCAAGAIASTVSLIPTLLMARGDVSLLVRLHLVIDPLRILVFFLVLYTYRNSLSYAIVFLVFFVISVPYIYYLKGKVQKTDFSRLFPGILTSALVCCITLTVPYLIFISFNEFTPIWLVPLGIITLFTWLSAIIWVRHPLSDDKFFKSTAARIGVYYA